MHCARYLKKLKIILKRSRTADNVFRLEVSAMNNAFEKKKLYAPERMLYGKLKNYATEIANMVRNEATTYLKQFLSTSTFNVVCFLQSQDMCKL